MRDMVYSIIIKQAVTLIGGAAELPENKKRGW